MKISLNQILDKIIHIQNNVEVIYHKVWFIYKNIIIDMIKIKFRYIAYLILIRFFTLKINFEVVSNYKKN